MSERKRAEFLENARELAEKIYKNTLENHYDEKLPLTMIEDIKGLLLQFSKEESERSVAEERKAYEHYVLQLESIGKTVGTSGFIPEAVIDLKESHQEQAERIKELEAENAELRHKLKEKEDDFAVIRNIDTRYKRLEAELAECRETIFGFARTDIENIGTALFVSSKEWQELQAQVERLEKERHELSCEFPWNPAEDGKCHLTPAENAVKQYRDLQTKCRELTKENERLRNELSRIK